MSTSRFLKKLTAAEVGNTKTHEVYIRIPNDFDFKSFFNNSHVENGSVVEVNFNAIVSTKIIDTIAPQSYDLRFVYFANSNKEKRIPGLGPLFKAFNVEEGDVVCLEKKEDNSYSLTFLSPDTLQIYNGALLLNGSLELEKTEQFDVPSQNKSDIVDVSMAIINPLKGPMTIDGLANELKKMYQSMGPSGMHLFGLKYGKFLSDTNLKELCLLADIPESYKVELNKMRNLYSAIKEHKYGVCFYEDFKFNLSEATPNDSDNLKDLSQYLRAIRTKPFLLLAGISGTGKSRIVRQLAKSVWPLDSAEHTAQKPSNFEMIQVKPNWHDSSELIGYVSRIGDKPQFIAGDFLKFIAKAWENQNVPYFLCLDEMNLAPVEQYFAEYLSVIESRNLQEDGISIKTDPILKKVDEEWYLHLVNSITSNDLEPQIKEDFLTHGIRIPQNLIVVGTVNMDETTYSFSRKVLDRAMTIEMNDVDLKGGLHKLDNVMPYIPSDHFISDAVEGYDVYEVYEDVCNTVIDYLNAVNEKLDKTPFKIAYRTRNEFIIYVVNALRLTSKEDSDTDEKRNIIIAGALDEVTSMKILSRIEGDKRKLFFLDDLKNTIKSKLDGIDGDNRSEERSISLAKLTIMGERLKSGYTSFWD